MLESSTAHGVLVQLATLFEPQHTTLKDSILQIRHPEILGIATPAVKASPLELFCKAVERIGSHRKTLNAFLTDNTVPQDHISLFGDDVSLSVQSEQLYWSAWIDSTDYETLAATLVFHGMLHQAFAEFGGSKSLGVGGSAHYVASLKHIGETCADPMRWGTTIWKAPPRMIQGEGRNFLTFAEDLAMLTRENVVIGLRSQWARRVAVPIFQANKYLQGRDANPVNALEILGQCADEALARSLSTWIKGNYRIEWTNKELV